MLLGKGMTAGQACRKIGVTERYQLTIGLLNMVMYPRKEPPMAKAKKRPLTKKQAAVLEYVIACIEKEGRTPTIRQIGTKFKLRSTGSVRDVVAALVKKGELVKDAALSRGVRLNPKKYIVRVSKKK